MTGSVPGSAVGPAVVSNAVLLFVLGLSVAVVYRAWQNRPRPGSYTLAVFALAVAVWNASHLLAHLTPFEPFFQRLEWLGVGSVAFAWLLFVFAYAGYERLLTRTTVALTAAWPVAVNLLIWVPPVAAGLGVDPGFSVWPGLSGETSALFWGHLVVSYGLFAVGTLVLLGFVLNASGAFRRQGLGVLFGMVVLWLASVVSAFELLGNVHLHALPAGMTVMGVAVLWSVERARLTDVVPVAARTVLRTMNAGVLVVDGEERLLEANPRARDLFDLPARDDVVGEPLAAVLSSSPVDRTAFRDAVAATTDGGSPADTGTGTGTGTGAGGSEDGQDADNRTVSFGDRVVRVETSPLRDARGTPAGRVFICNDVTELKRRQAALRRQNERLDRFTSIVSHDLRNPLSVASGHLAHVRDAESYDEDRHAAIADALDRMERIIEDTLVLARDGDPVTDLTWTPFENVVRRCWGQVATADATLSVADSFAFECYPDRVDHLFENLFRNAVEHGGPDVTVRAGRLADGRGFYVEDDGPGIDPDERDAVFEAGYTTADGTGFGLPIVEGVADAHGWTVTVTEGKAGGARFEVTDVAVEN